MLPPLAMIRGARAALAVVAIFSFAFVLITPDPTDDLDGVLRPNHTARARNNRQSRPPSIRDSRICPIPFADTSECYSTFDHVGVA